jgi:hypothetical protein
MANSLFIETKEAMLKGGANLDVQTGMAAALIDHADDTPNPAAAGDDFWDDIAAAARVATVALTGELVTNNVFDADDAVWTSVTGDVAESVVIYKDTGSEATSRLFAFFDTLTGLPVTPGGGNITAAWNASGIWAL